MLFTFQLFVESPFLEKESHRFSVTSDWILLFGELPRQRLQHFGEQLRKASRVVFCPKQNLMGLLSGSQKSVRSWH